MVFIALFVLGLVSLSRLGLDMFPDISLPSVMVATAYPGVGPYEVESGITREIEEAVSSINGVKSVSSSSSEGISQVIINFDWNMDMDTIVPEVREKLNAIEDDLPEGAERSVILKFNPENLPSMEFNLFSTVGGLDLRKLAEDEVIPEIEKIEGVARAKVFGGREAAVIAQLDLDSIGKLEIPITQVLQTFQGENISLPAGSLSIEDRHMTLRTIGDFESIDDIENVLVGYRGRVPVFLGDIAEVELDYLVQEEFARAGTEEGVMVSIRKQPGHNTVQVNNAIKERLETIAKRLPPSVQIQVQSDQSLSVLRSIGGVARAAWQGGLLAILVLLFFLRNIRSTLIIAVVIPVSVITTFSLMDFGGLTMNIISLMGITLGVGMFVDNSIVVLESVFRKKLAGHSSVDSAVGGTAEVGKAITASTLTTMAVFLPMIFVEGIAGLIFKDLALTITFALFISLTVALTLIPVLCSKFLSLERGVAVEKTREKLEERDYELSLADMEVRTGNRVLDGAARIVQSGLKRLDNGYERLIRWSLHHAGLVVASAGVLLVMSVGSILLLGMEFLPEADEGQFLVDVETKVGSSYQVTEEKIEQVERIVMEVCGEDIEALSSQIGESGALLTVSGGVGSNLGAVFVTLVEKDFRKRSVWQIVDRVEERLEDELFDCRTMLKVRGLASMAATATGESEPVVIKLTGNNLDNLFDYSLKLRDTMEEVRGIRNVQVSHKKGKPELQFRIKRREALSLGFTPLEIASTIRAAYKGAEVTRYTSAQDDYPVIVILGDEDRQLKTLTSMFLVNRDGKKILLENLVDIEEDTGPLSISRENRIRTVKVTATLTGEKALSDVVEELEADIDELGAPPLGVELEFAGSTEEMTESFKGLFLALVLAIVLVYMVLASQFESFLHPFIVMLSVPFAVIGLVAALLVTNTTFSIVSFIGAILLVGIVVNNAIVFIDYINHLRRSGVSLVEAIVKGGKTRLKPILMTTLTTVLGLLPMALSLGTGSEIRAPIGRAVVGGLSTSTLVTLVLIPTIYWLFEAKLRRHRP
jgi:HAE1 family hydrophobic/amphiphilic exporter-1